jgi:phosphohistidine phosphatase
MELFFLRHGLADRNQWSGPDDKRPLTEDGKSKMAKQARYMVSLKLPIRLILTSPLVRARQTAEIVAGEFGDVNLVIESRLSPGFDIRILQDILQERAETNALMVVGHEPDFSQTIGDLIGGGQVVMKKGGLAYVNVIRLDPPAGELVWLLPPRLMLP